VISNKELITTLVDVHHLYLRKTFRHLFGLVKELGDGGDEGAVALVPEIETAVGALDDHFRDEEENLFPKILKAEEAVKTGSAEYYEVLIRDLISEHEETKAFFEKAVVWSESVAGIKKNAELSGGFVTLAVVLNAHILIEEELLFPRAEAIFKNKNGLAL
jgi:iron-sulfur cluster repair protein YtfE (RIC family)